jgi:hypothetical protein
VIILLTCHCVGTIAALNPEAFALRAVKHTLCKARCCSLVPLICMTIYVSVTHKQAPTRGQRFGSDSIMQNTTSPHFAPSRAMSDSTSSASHGSACDSSLALPASLMSPRLLDGVRQVCQAASPGTCSCAAASASGATDVGELCWLTRDYARTPCSRTPWGEVGFRAGLVRT